VIKPIDDEKRQKPRGNQRKIFNLIPRDGMWIGRFALHAEVMMRGFGGSEADYTKALYELRDQRDIEIGPEGRHVRRTQMWLLP
jgi:hypothetical protein